MWIGHFHVKSAGSLVTSQCPLAPSHQLTNRILFWVLSLQAGKSRGEFLLGQWSLNLLCIRLPCQCPPKLCLMSNLLYAIIWHSSQWVTLERYITQNLIRYVAKEWTCSIGPGWESVPSHPTFSQKDNQYLVGRLSPLTCTWWVAH